MWAWLGIGTVIWAFFAGGMWGGIGMIAFWFAAVYFFHSDDDTEGDEKPSRRSREKTATFSNLGKTLWTGSRKLHIEYTNQQGEVSERDIDLKAIKANSAGEIYFRAYCHLRNETRSFKADRVGRLFTARDERFDDFVDYMHSELHV